ncbi:hypothetical protein ACNJYD_04360 [Bradyrhizobium sp. DASA03005]|uniref:hypothetical protein n=1 Tax=Bradyrhizobium sp. SPXBL-02 TaxID=3395912 RepID=UPI003F6FDA08
MLQAIAEVGWSALLLLSLVVSIRQLTRWGQATEINWLLYAFSFVLVVRLAVDFAAYVNDYGSLHVFLEQHLGIPSKYTLALHEWLTNVRDELILVATIIVVAIAPQLLTYVLAGLFGCAKSPPLVWHFEQFAAWSLIKFLAALSGILFEGAISPTENRGLPAWTTSNRQQALWALTMLAISFGFAVIQTRVIEIKEGRAKSAFRLLWPGRLRSFFTRNLPERGERRAH